MKQILILFILIFQFSSVLHAGFGCRQLAIASGSITTIKDTYEKIYVSMIDSRTAREFKSKNEKISIFIETGRVSSVLKKDLIELEKLSFDRNSNVDFYSEDAGFRSQKAALWLSCAGAAICALAIASGHPINLFAIPGVPITAGAYIKHVFGKRQYKQEKNELNAELFLAIEAAVKSGEKTSIFITGDDAKGVSDVMQKLEELNFNEIE